MLEKLFEQMFETPKMLEVVKKMDMTKENWEEYKKEQLEEMKEVDKYFEELKNKEKPLLTDEEKEYLSAVIKPFRNKIKYIEKSYLVSTQRGHKEYIRIDLEIDDVCLPLFEKGKCYQGLELRREYTLKELGL